MSDMDERSARIAERRARHERIIAENQRRLAEADFGDLLPPRPCVRDALIPRNEDACPKCGTPRSDLPPPSPPPEDET